MNEYQLSTDVVIDITPEKKRAMPLDGKVFPVKYLKAAGVARYKLTKCIGRNVYVIFDKPLDDCRQRGVYLALVGGFMVDVAKIERETKDGKVVKVKKVVKVEMNKCWLWVNAGPLKGPRSIDDVPYGDEPKYFKVISRIVRAEHLKKK